MADAASIKAGLRSAFRDHEVDGLPASGAYDPDKAVIRLWLGELTDLAAAAGTTKVVATVADLSTLSAPEVGDRAEVRDDPAGDVEDGNGVYGWSGSAWVWISDLLPSLDNITQASSGASADEGATRAPVWDVHDQQDRAALEVFSDGAVGVSHLVFTHDGRPPNADDGMLIAPVEDKTRRPAGGWLGDGTFLAVPAYAMLAAIGRGLALVPAEVLRGTLASVGVNVRFAPDRTIGGYVATVTEGTPDTGSRVIDVLQPSGERSPLGGALSTEAGYVDVVLTAGQSNSLIQPDTPWDKAPYAHSIVTFSVNPAIAGPTAFNPTNQRDLIPLADTGSGQYLQTLVANRKHWDRLRSGVSAPPMVVAAAGQGGQALTEFQSGTVNATNLTASATRAAELVARFGRTARAASILWVQGEAGPTGYAALLDPFITERRTAVEAAMVAGGGAAGLPHFFLVQTNTSETIVSATDEDVRQAQLEVGLDRTGDGVTLCGPTYQGILVDGIHSSHTARMAIADAVGRIQHLVLDQGETFSPLHIVSAVRVGAVITVTLALPLETTTVAVDEDYVLPIEDYGFRFTDDSGATPAISSVVIASATTLTITLASVPTGGAQTLRYAFDNLTESTDPNWPAGRGQIMAETNQPSLFHKLGYAVPEKVRHYLCAAIVPVTV